MNIYNFNADYIKKLVKTSKYTNKTKLAELLDVTVNTINLKLSGRTLIYINEGIVISNALKMNINDVFCPTDETMFNKLYSESIKVFQKEHEYPNPFNFSSAYITDLIHNAGLTKENICKLWNLKIVSIYDKLKGETKITVREGIQLAELLETDVESIFCPTKELQMNSLINKKYANTNIVKEITKIKPYLSTEELKKNKDHIKQIIKQIPNKKLSDLSIVWNISVTHCYNKLNGASKITPDEAIKLSKFIEKPLAEIFIPTTNV